MTSSDWKNTGWYIEARGSRHLLSVIGSIGGYSSEARIAWRGQPSSDYDLVSSLQRSPGIKSEVEMREREHLLLDSARKWGLGFGPTGWASDLQLLADLQHYGTATRLLDVTSNPMTALWFACQQVHLGSTANDGLLLALNTAGWKRYGRSHPSGSPTALENPLSWELEAALNEAEPFVVESLTPNDRLRAQEGFFVAGRIPQNFSKPDPFKSFRIDYEPTTYENLTRRLTARFGEFDERDRLPFVAIIIPAKLKQRVLLRLANTYNRRPEILFPDFFGFRDHGSYAKPRQPLEGSSSIY